MKMRRAAKAVIIFSILVIALFPAFAVGEEPDPCAAGITKPEWLENAELPGASKMPSDRFDYDYSAGKWRDVSYGIGLLIASPPYYWSQMYSNEHELIEMPLFDGPHGNVWGWFVKGSVADRKNKRLVPVGAAGMLEFGHEQRSVIVLEKTPDGWMKIRFGAMDAPRGGTAWIPECQLNHVHNVLSLHFSSWEALFLSDWKHPLIFRSDVPHSLRKAPSTTSTRLGMISGDYRLIPLEIEGDWMRVKAVTPSNYCVGKDMAMAPPTVYRSEEMDKYVEEFSCEGWTACPISCCAGEDVEVTVREGWVKWRSQEKGPWVSFFLSSCSDRNDSARP